MDKLNACLNHSNYFHFFKITSHFYVLCHQHDVWEWWNNLPEINCFVIGAVSLKRTRSYHDKTASRRYSQRKRTLSRNVTKYVYFYCKGIFQNKLGHCTVFRKNNKFLLAFLHSKNSRPALATNIQFLIPYISMLFLSKSTEYQWNL